MSKGNLLCAFYPQDNHPPSSAMATLTTRNRHAVLAFDDSAVESAFFHGMIPWNYEAGNGFTVWIIWMAASAVTLSTRWRIFFERHNDEGTDLDTDSFATSITLQGTTVAPATSGAVQYTSIAVLDDADLRADGLRAGESFRLQVRRDATTGTDDMVGDAQLLAVELRETI